MFGLCSMQMHWTTRIPMYFSWLAGVKTQLFDDCVNSVFLRHSEDGCAMKDYSALWHQLTAATKNGITLLTLVLIWERSFAAIATILWKFEWKGLHNRSFPVTEDHTCVTFEKTSVTIKAEYRIKFKPKNIFVLLKTW